MAGFPRVIPGGDDLLQRLAIALMRGIADGAVGEHGGLRLIGNAAMNARGLLGQQEYDAQGREMDIGMVYGPGAYRLGGGMSSPMIRSSQRVNDELGVITDRPSIRGPRNEIPEYPRETVESLRRDKTFTNLDVGRADLHHRLVEEERAGRSLRGDDLLRLVAARQGRNMDFGIRVRPNNHGAYLVTDPIRPGGYLMMFPDGSAYKLSLRDAERAQKQGIPFKPEKSDMSGGLQTPRNRVTREEWLRGQNIISDKSLWQKYDGPQPPKWMKPYGSQRRYVERFNEAQEKSDIRAVSPSSHRDIRRVRVPDPKHKVIQQRLARLMREEKRFGRN